MTWSDLRRSEFNRPGRQLHFQFNFLLRYGRCLPHRRNKSSNERRPIFRNGDSKRGKVGKRKSNETNWSKRIPSSRQRKRGGDTGRRRPSGKNPWRAADGTRHVKKNVWCKRRRC